MSDEIKKQIVIFRENKEDYGVEITDLIEIINWMESTSVPNSPDYIQGILNLRGRVVVLIDLAKKLNSDNPSQAHKKNILIFEVNNELYGIAIDEIREIIHVSDTEIKPPGALSKNSSVEKCIKGIIIKKDKEKSTIVVILDLLKLI